jgi:two-component system response regulator AtoC
MRILVIDDEESIRHMLSVILKKEGYEVSVCADAESALKVLEAEEFDFVLSDIRMPGLDGLDFLKAFYQKGFTSTIIMMSAYGTVDKAIECMKLGAYDYISKPFKADEIILTIKKAEERERLKRENLRLKGESVKEYDFGNVFAKDLKMLEILDLAKKVSDYSTTVLITGETGTGKELVARTTHFSGKRKTRSFVEVNCGAIPANLLESELFGHVKGAFTDAIKTKDGLFHEADGGTIFLDEVGELPRELQVKLLRVLQEGEVRRVGDTRSKKVDVRVVAATVMDLTEEIKKGDFREDLYYRLNVIPIKVPPLRERNVEVQGLAEHFVKKYSKKFGKPLKVLSKDAIEVLLAYPWPGNVRELENVIERALILEEGSEIGADVLPISERVTGGQLPIDLTENLSIKKAEEALERELIKRALEKTKGNRTKAAELLEISNRAKGTGYEKSSWVFLLWNSKNANKISRLCLGTSIAV